MKKIYILPLLAATLFFSCTNELDQNPVSDIGSENFYRDEDDFEQAINGIYSSLQTYPDHQLVLSEIRSDNMYAITNSGIRDHEPVNNFFPTIATNSYIAEVWSKDFEGILRANTVLDRMTDEAVPDENMRNRMIGEARFMRAFFYFDLVRFYGKVPLLDHVVTPEESLEIGRSNVSEIYTLIIADLEDAINKLPESYPAEQRGKVTLWAAKAMLGKVYLTRSGTSYDIEGPGMDSGEYDLALSLFDDIINNGPYAFIDDYDTIFAYDNENNSEIIFDIQYKDGSLGIGATYPGLFVPDNYFEAIGIPFPAGGEYKAPSENLLHSFDDNDIRYNTIFQEGYTDANGNPIADIFIVKFLDTENPGTDRFDWPINFPLIRYTEVLMMKAEAILFGGTGNPSDADEIVNRIRDRANLQPLTAVTTDQLLEEKRREFAGEGTRWHDLVRSGKVLDIMNTWIPEDDVSDKIQAPINQNSIIYPLPSTQITVKEGLYDQNPGYN
ncbi:Starch-binding associating with outer membrane [Sinomicrobium oceani]|uniref:Starch-binding associating with outer membrane n=1 Tax=Sinomicrobium oceani TaxID=1150368 RepID=A0A1K1RI28_9FLAO|nr:RagB/SusD family nutrient uptake outer membrane protein [Sinomicrobium oceani]SFW71492.1 Starch-binding associating with outer membrane [Sinomicrobium oceani]